GLELLAAFTREGNGHGFLQVGRTEDTTRGGKLHSPPAVSRGVHVLVNYRDKGRRGNKKPAPRGRGGWASRKLVDSAPHRGAPSSVPQSGCITQPGVAQRTLGQRPR